MRLRCSHIIFGVLIFIGFSETYSFTSCRSIAPLQRNLSSQQIINRALLHLKKEDTEDDDSTGLSTLSKIRSGIVSLGIALLSFTAGGIVAIFIALNVPDWKPQPVMLFQIILSDLDRYYVDEIDTRRLLETSVSAMLRSLDPFSEYQDSMDKSSKSTRESRYGGIGLTISGVTKSELETVGSKQKFAATSSVAASALLPGDAMEDAMEDGEEDAIEQRQSKQARLDKEKEVERLKLRGIRVVSAFEGGSFDYGVRVGDQLLRVNDLEIGPNTAVEDVTDALQGPARTFVELTYKRDGEPNVRKVTIPRSITQVKDVKLATFLDDTTGYIKLKSFSKTAGQEVSQAVQALQGQNRLDGLILDLRGNKGGDISSAVDVSSVFVPKGSEIVSTKGRNAARTIYRNNADPVIDRKTKIAVIVNEETSSGAEVVAAAIQDLDLGLVVGKDRTKGMGFIQSTATLPYNAEIRYTSAKFYSPSGRSIQTSYDEDGRLIQNSDRRVFYTKNGRKIRDGGGVEADLKISPRAESDLEFVLKKSEAFQDFAAEWSQSHRADDENFFVDDETYKQFQNYVVMKQQKGDVKLEGVYDGALSVLRNNLKISGYDDSATRGLDSLQASIVKEIQTDFDKYGTFIKEDIAQAILAREFPDSALVKRTLTVDKQVQAALTVLENNSRFETILTKGSTPGKTFVASIDE